MLIYKQASSEDEKTWDLSKPSDWKKILPFISLSVGLVILLLLMVIR